MPKIPKNPEQIFQEFTNDYKSTFGEDLIAIILYGSAARGEYIYKKSDINFLIVLSGQGINNLRRALPLIPKWKKKNVSTPLMLTQEYIQSALDSFPVEFLTMKQHYRVVYGENVFEKIEIKPEHLRLQCEREMRGKLLYLREGYLNTNGKPAHIKRLISLSLPAFSSIFSALLHLKNEEIPGSKQDIFLKTADVFKLDSKVFETILELKNKKSKLKKEQLYDLMEHFIEQIAKLTDITDQL
ncbi:MAG TPA: nucleotidyltransferase domain-containing protein [bacterium]